MKMKPIIRGLVTRPALFSALLYLALAFLPRHTLPFVEREMFKFALSTKPVVIPVSFIAGKRRHIETVVDLEGIAGSDVDIEHRGYHSSVEYRFREQKKWIENNSNGTRGPGPIEVVIGVQILDFSNGMPTLQFREDGRGTAWPK